MCRWVTRVTPGSSWSPKVQLRRPTNLSRRVIVYKWPASWQMVCDQIDNNASCLPWELAIFVQLEDENVERLTLWIDAPRSHLHLICKVSMLKTFALESHAWKNKCWRWKDGNSVVFTKLNLLWCLRADTKLVRKPRFTFPLKRKPALNGVDPLCSCCGWDPVDLERCCWHSD